MRQSATTRIAIWLAALALAAGACAGGEPSGAPTTPTAGPPASPTGDADPDSVAGPVETIRLAGGDFGYPSPFAWVRGPGKIQAGLIFDPLIWVDGSGEFIPWLAREWEQSADGLTWTFTLRDGIQWHDGEPLTAQDVAFTFDYLTDGPGSETRASSGLGVVDDVVATDDRTAVFHLPSPFGPFEEGVASDMLIIPEHVWSEVDDPAKLRGPEAVMGSGAYMLDDLDEAAGSYRYVANEDFFLGPPVVRVLEFVPAEDELLALQRGEIDAAEIAREPIPQQQLEALRASFDELDGTRDWNLALHFNLTAGFPYDEVDFRKGVAHAIDREDLVSRRLFGAGIPGSPGGLSPDHPMFAEDLPSYPHDVEQAGDMFDAIGLVDADGDGFRDLPDGSPFRPELLASNRFPQQGPELVREHLRAAGLAVELRILDRGAADDAAAEGTYTLALVGYGGILSDPDFLRSRYASTSESSSFSNALGYRNPRFDELAQEQLVAVDRAERRRIVQEMQHLLAGDLPVLSLYVPERKLFYDGEVFDGWSYTPGCSACRGTRNKLIYVTGGPEL